MLIMLCVTAWIVRRVLKKLQVTANRYHQKARAAFQQGIHAPGLRSTNPSKYPRKPATRSGNDRVSHSKREKQPNKIPSSNIGQPVLNSMFSLPEKKMADDHVFSAVRPVRDSLPLTAKKTHVSAPFSVEKSLSLSTVSQGKPDTKNRKKLFKELMLEQDIQSNTFE